jgi:hypothetical protein
MPRTGLPWIVLVNPTAAWRALREGRPSPWPALLYQLLLLGAGWLVARRPMAQLAEVSGLGSANFGFGTLLVGMLATVALLAILALLLRLYLLVLGTRLAYPVVLTWLAHGATPVFLGRFLGLLSFAVFQPLAADRAGALALQLNPLGLSLAGRFAPLSLPWALAAALDVFTLWSLAILAVGALQFLRLNHARAAALLAALLVIWLLVSALLWQGLQRSL